MDYLFLYIKNNVNNNKLTIMLIIPAIISELSDIKYPCNNHKKLVIKIIIREYTDKSSTLFDIYVLCNCGNNCIQLNMGANLAIISGIIIQYICKLYKSW